MEANLLSRCRFRPQHLFGSTVPVSQFGLGARFLSSSKKRRELGALHFQTAGWLPIRNLCFQDNGWFLTLGSDTFFLDREVLLFVPCTSPRKPATVTEKSSNWAIFSFFFFSDFFIPPLFSPTFSAEPQEHTVAEFLEFCAFGRTAKSGLWSSKGVGKYLEGGKAAGGQLVDQRFCPRIVEGAPGGGGGVFSAGRRGFEGF